MAHEGAVANIILGCASRIVDVVLLRNQRRELRQGVTPHEVQGRMFASVRFLEFGAMLLGAALGGILGQSIGPRATLFVAVGLTFVASAWLALSPVARLWAMPAMVVEGAGSSAARCPEPLVHSQAMTAATALAPERAARLERPDLPRLDSLTGLRFFAAYMVLMHHFTNFAQLPLIWHWAGFGTTGVSFFFVLSGFVLTWSFVPSDTAPRFYWRRFARVWPLHFITTVMAVPVFYMWRDAPMDWTGVTLSVFLLHAWVPTVSTYFAGNPASWSLSCEMFFYALHPLLVRRTLVAGLALLASATGVVLAALYLVADLAIDWPARIAGWLLYVSPLFRLGEFLVGMALAAAIRRGVRFPIGVIPAAMLLGGWFTLYYNVAPHLGAGLQIVIADLSYPALAVLYALLIAAAAQLDLQRKPSLLRWKPMVMLGQWSYALYLVHATIIYGLVELIGARSYSAWNVGWLVLVSGLAVAASAALYHAIEHPLEARLRRMQQRAPAAEVVSERAAAAAG